MVIGSIVWYCSCIKIAYKASQSKAKCVIRREQLNSKANSRNNQLLLIKEVAMQFASHPDASTFCKFFDSAIKTRILNPNV
uniref:Uncharacterized protein n=1 Tax=Romanomermis culicivorax TaxID=13658 RepID=A0A915J5D7_ROMCU